MLQLRILKRLSFNTLAVLIGIFCSQCSWAQYMTSYFTSKVSQTGFYTHMLSIMLGIMTLLNLKVTLDYMFYGKFSSFNYIYEYFWMPIFTLKLLAYSNDQQNQTDSIILIALFLIGWICTVVFIINFNTNQPEAQSESVLRISISPRVYRLLKYLAINVIMYWQVFEDGRIVYIVCLIFNAIDFFIFVTTFTFQSPYLEYICLVANVAASISSIDVMLYAYGIGYYGFIGQIFMISAFLFQFDFLIRFLEAKYTYFAKVNQQMRDQTEMLACLCIIREIIGFKEATTFQYSPGFVNQMLINFKKMLDKQKIVPVENGETEQNQEHLLFIELCNKRLRKSQDFVIYQFYLMNLISKSTMFKNRALTVFYQKKQKAQSSPSIFLKLQSKILHQNLLKHMQITPEEIECHHIMIFQDKMKELSQMITILAKKEVQAINSLSNLANFNSTQFSNHFIDRNLKKTQIEESIDEILLNKLSIQSGIFLYLCLLFKVIFCRQVNTAQAKFMKKFIIAQSLKKNISHKIESFKDEGWGILICSSRPKGLILNENQAFTNIYRSKIGKHKQSKQSIHNLLPDPRQKFDHIQLMEESQLCISQKKIKHCERQCYLARKVHIDQFTSQFSQQVFESFNTLITKIEKVRIDTHIHIQIEDQFCYLCVIKPDQIYQNQSGFRILQSDLQKITSATQQEFNIKKLPDVQQLGVTLKMCILQVPCEQYSRDFAESQSQENKQEINLSETVFQKIISNDSQNTKFQKIQRMLDHQKLNHYKMSMYFILKIFLVVVVCAVSEILITSFLTQMYQKKHQIIHIKTSFFKGTAMTEKRIALSLYIYQLAKTGFFPEQACSSYGVQKMSAYIQSNLISYIQTAYEEIHHESLSKQYQDMDITNLFNDNLYVFPEHYNQPEEQKISYGRYISLTKSLIFDFLEIIETIRPQQKQAFDNYIYTSLVTSDLDPNSFYSNIQRMLNRKVSNLRNDFLLILILYLLLLTVSVIYVIYLMQNLHYQKHKYFDIVKNLGKKFVSTRCKQMHFITDQIALLMNNQIFNVSLSKDLKIHVHQGKVQKVFSFEQFDKYSKTQQNDIKESEYAQQMLQDSKNSETAKLLNSKHSAKGEDVDSQMNSHAFSRLIHNLWRYKFKYIFIFLSFGLMAMVQIYRSSIYRAMIQKDTDYQAGITQMQSLFGAINDLLISEWLVYSGRMQLDSFQRMVDAMQVLRVNPYKQVAYNIFSIQQRKEILYTNYCQDYRDMIKEFCRHMKGGILEKGLALIVPAFLSDFQKSMGYLPYYRMTADYRNEICEKTILNLEFLYSKFGQKFSEGFHSVHVEFEKSLEQLQYFLALSCILFFVIMLIIAAMTVNKLMIIRAQVLSLDSAQNLYKNHQRYQPLLNRLFYNDSHT